MSTSGTSSAAVPVSSGEMGSKAYMGGEGVRYRMGARSAFLLNEEDIANLLVENRGTRCWAASRMETAPGLQLRARQLRFADERTALESHSHEVRV